MKGSSSSTSDWLSNIANLRKEDPAMIRKNKAPSKMCPFRDEVCQKHGCEIYNEKLDRCEIGLLAYNAFLVASEMKQFNENQNLK
jgi:hypothetical protein